MKTLFKKLLFHIVVIVVLYVALAALVGITGMEKYVRSISNLEGAYGYLQPRLKNAKSTKSDIIVLGSSHAYEGVDPKLFTDEHGSLYNLGSSGQTPMVSYHLLKEYIPILEPKHLILEVYWGTYCSAGNAESCIDIISNEHLNTNYFQMALSSLEPKVINTFVSQWFRQAANIPERPQKEIFNQINHERGFTEQIGVVDEERLLKLDSARPTVNKEKLRYIEQIVELCLDNDIHPVLIRTPVTTAYFDQLKNYDEVTSPIVDLCNRYNISFVDFNRDSTLNLINENFADKNHLNGSGVEIFNTHLYNYLKDNSFF